MMKLNLIRPMQLSAMDVGVAAPKGLGRSLTIALMGSLAITSCGGADVAETTPDNTEIAPAEVPEEVVNAVDAAIQSEGKTSLGSMVRGQQVYFLEAGKFSSTFEDLGLGLEPETEQYTYTITDANDTQIIATATAKQDGLKSYSAAVFASEGNTIKGVCESDVPDTTPPEAPQLEGAEVSCPGGSTLVD